MRTQGSVEIDAPPERVFYWIDDAERVKAWLPNLVESEDLEVTGNRIGSTFRQVYLENNCRMEMQGVVTGYEPNRRLACEMHSNGFDLTVDYRLEDLGGRTRLTQDSQVRMKGLWRIVGLVMGPFLRRSSQRQLDQALATLKRCVEQASSDED